MSYGNNNFAGTCCVCGKFVSEGMGIIYKHNPNAKKWLVKCKKCANGNLMEDANGYGADLSDIYDAYNEYKYSL